jgi:O-antigen/teichoic acid export membrane protein
MKRNTTNAVYGVFDYASFPLGMLLVAPIILHKIGAAEYGLWMVSTAIISAGGIIASGFCDAGIQRIAQLRGADRASMTVHAFRTMFSINLALGCLVALLMWIASPYAARHLAVLHLLSPKECLACLRIASVSILIRAIEAVSVSTQRAFEEYRGTVLISAAIRVLTLGFAAVLALLGRHTESIMILIVVLLSAGTFLQFCQLPRYLNTRALWPRLHVQETRALIRSGVFVWLQTLGSVVFRQFDRILLGVSLGAAAVAPYSLCIQLAEPLFGLTASGLSFFFPYLSGRANSLSKRALRHAVLKAFLCNLFFVLGSASLLLVFGRLFLQIWAGPAMARHAKSILPLIVIGSALSGLSVTGTYAVQALGLFRIAACISIGSRSALFLLMFYLLHHQGLHGLAMARVYYGAAALLVYLPLIRQLGPFRTAENSIPSSPVATEIQEGAHL